MAKKKAATKVTARALGELGYNFWLKEKTLESGHFDNLKYDDGEFRVWVSRMTPEDYGEGRIAREAWMAERFTVQHLIRGSWEDVWP